MTGHIVPVDAIVVELIQQSQTVFGGTVLLEFTIVGLGQTNTTLGRPITLVAFGGGGQLLQSGSPEPAIDVGGLQIGTFTALEIANTTTGPDVFYLERYENYCD